MEIEFFGANCFRIKTKKTVIVVDDNLASIGGKSIQNDKTTVFYTSADLVDEVSSKKSKLMLDSPGEFEVGEMTVTGMQARAHTDKEDEMNATVIRFMANGQTIVVLGHIHPSISEEITEFISGTDVLVVPVGGNGYTLDPTGAAKVIKRSEPDVVIPSQYDIKGLSYEVPAQPLSEFEQLPTVKLAEPQDSFKLGDNSVEDSSAITTQIVVLNVKE